VGCKVKVNRHGFIAFHLFWNKNRSWEGTGLRDTAENRRLVEAKAVLIGREIKKGTFDYLKWFPEGNRAEQFRPKEKHFKTIGEYYRAWIPRKTPPVVRPGLERDYRALQDLHTAKVRKYPAGGSHAGTTRSLPKLSPAGVRSAHIDKEA
jgi:hypothetical protein